MKAAGISRLGAKDYLPQFQGLQEWLSFIIDINLSKMNIRGSRNVMFSSVIYIPVGHLVLSITDDILLPILAQILIYQSQIRAYFRAHKCRC